MQSVYLTVEQTDILTETPLMGKSYEKKTTTKITLALTQTILKCHHDDDVILLHHLRHLYCPQWRQIY